LAVSRHEEDAVRANSLKQKLLRDEIGIGIILLSADPHVVGIAAGAGFDYVMADLEHTGATLREVEAVVRAADCAGIVPLARVAGPTKADILGVLETGVRGIMVPAVENAEEAKSAVAAARYAPLGRRGVYYMGYGSSYCRVSPADYFPRANEELLVILQIETVEGLRNLTDIAAVPDADCLLVGPGDLSASLGIPWEFEHPALWDAIGQVFDTARLHGKAAGLMPLNVEHARRAADRGGRLLIWGPDLALLQRAAHEDAARLQESLRWTPVRSSKGAGAE
jgi:2-keto-3-deoxy-L-rhamnonate aldolase RhmA